ncbi:hypothetical protein V1509DRAFT_619301 [Lipomyces kononenkoae]
MARVSVEVCEKVVATAEKQGSFTVAAIAAAAEICGANAETEEACSFVTAASEIYDDDEDETTDDICSFITATAEVCGEAVADDITIIDRDGFNLDDVPCLSMQDMRNHSVPFSDFYNATGFSDIHEREYDSIHDLKQGEIRELSVAKFRKDVAIADEPGSLKSAITKKSHAMGTCESMMVGASQNVVIAGTKSCSGYEVSPDCVHCFGPQHNFEHSVPSADFYDPTSFDAEVRIVSERSETMSSCSSAVEHDSCYSRDLKQCEICKEIALVEAPYPLSRPITNILDYMLSCQERRRQSRPRKVPRSSVAREPLTALVQPDKYC